ncbi:SH3-domain-containing protein [Calocera cornea HHB12733]|uniref:SH3-domain-containing protein n=1 Tax=Calocera cornea HHB12733 TaxID=1353952 RepID=A0A165CMB4_9BASI|nr:SH3-domain-containing protein [Calocera cornea HHB12733]
MSAPFVEHITARIRADLDFLEQQHLITRPDKETILAKLPSSDVRSLDNRLSSLSLSPSSAAGTARTVPARPGSTRPAPQPQLPQARANWAYNSGDPQDLQFNEGDVIELVEEENADWWKGRLNGREGLLPANYVTKIAPTPMRSPNPPAYSPGQHQVLAPKSYQAPSGPPPWATPSPQPMQYAPPPQQYAPPPQPMPVMQQDQPKPSRFGNLGTTMANAAAGGLGFGAGAAIGGDLVNAIF